MLGQQAIEAEEELGAGGRTESEDDTKIGAANGMVGAR